MKRRYPDLSRLRGFTMIELAIVLGIIGILIGSIWAVSRSVSQGQKASDLVRQTTETANAVRDRFLSIIVFPSTPAPWGGSGTDVTDFFGEGTGSAVTPLHLLPIEMSQGGGKYLHVFGGTFKMSIIGYPTATDPVNTMHLQLQAIPITACVQFVTQLPAGDNAVGIMRVVINGTTLNSVSGYTGPGGTPAWTSAWPMSVASIAALCNGAIAGSSEVDIDFKLHP